MSDSFNSNVTTISADPFIFVPIELLRNTIAEFVAAGRSMSGVAQVRDLVVMDLEWYALMARLAGRTHVFEGKITVTEALQRSLELQQLVLS